MKLRAHNNERGSILIIVLWIAFGLVSMALYFGQSMTHELRASDNRVGSIEADQAINSAVRYVSYILSQTTNGMLPDPQLYQREAVPVGQAKFWLIGRDTNQIAPDKMYYGLIDESSKLPLNSLTTNFLLYNLPNMTEQLQAAIIDWKSKTTTPSDQGAKDETYNRLTPAYLCKNGKFESVDELHMVYGMDKELLYGEDANLNGILDANENDGDVLEPFDNRDGKLDPGFWEYFTVYSYESTNRIDGTAKININNAQQISQFQTLLQDRVSSSATRVVAAVRNRISPQAQPAQRGQPQQPAPQPQPFTSMIDLYITVSAAGMTEDDFGLIASDIYIPPSNTGPIVGAININTASEAVLSCIPGIDVTNAATIVAFRQSNPDRLTSVAWLVEAIGQAGAKTAGRYITAYTYQISADIAAVGHFGSGYRRVRFVFDLADSITGTSAPRVVYRQDLTHLGWALGRETRQNLTLAKNQNNQ
jgi:DNA uptake protein ComE-like DNA-binding protein